MDDIAGWLGSIAWPLVSKALVALGFGYLSFEGATAAVNGAIGAAKTAFGGMTGDVLQLMLLSGFFDAMAIMSGGLISGLAWMTMKKFAMVGTGAPA